MTSTVQAASAVVALKSPSGLRERVALDRIEVKDRLRPVDTDWAAALAVSIERDGGLIHPIQLRPLPGGRLRLVVGAHRLEAHRILGWAEIDAEILDIDAVTAKAREIAENLMRRELSPLDRAAFVAELYEVEKARAGWGDDESRQAFGARKRWEKDASARIAGASALPEAVASKVGLSERQVRYDLSLFRDLQPAVRDILRTHPVSENASQLRLLARSSEQARIARMLIDGEAADVARALAIVQPKPEGAGKKTPTRLFTDAWGRMGARERRDALRQLTGLPKGVRITFDGGDDD